MFELWIPLTVAAAFFQNLRSAVQKHLTGRLSTAGATYVRFFYAWPFSLAYLWAVAEITGAPLPPVNAAFFAYCAAGALAQIMFTFLLVWLFSFRNFAAGTVFSKTETVQVALFGLLILGDPLSAGAVVAIAISLVGVLALSVAETQLTWRNLAKSLFGKPTLIGLACGAVLGLSVVFYRGAALSLGDSDFLMRSALALTVAVLMQSLAMGVYLAVAEAGQWRAVLTHWKPGLAVGAAGAFASIFWFAAFTLQNAAYVRALGQIELVFTILASALFFREKIKPLEWLGAAFIVAGILVLVLARA